MSGGRGSCAHAPNFSPIDGNRFRSSLDIPYRCIVKGDGKYADIAAASVLAKTHRDEYMRRLAEEFPQYGWAKNKGYPTREHRPRREALRGDALSPADVQSRIGTAGTFLIGSAGDVRLPYFIVFRGTDRRTIDVGMRTLSFSPACAAWPLLQEGRSGTAAVAGEGTGSTAERQVCAHGPSSGAVGHGVPPAYGRSGVAEQSSTGFEPLRSGPREFFRTMVRM